MTTEEARAQIGRTVLHSDGSADPVEVVITGVGMFLTYVRWRHSHELKAVNAESLTPLPVQPTGAVAGQVDRDQVTASQARLNEFVAGMIRSGPGDRRLITLALKALREHNWAYGFAFGGSREPHGLAAHRKFAVLATEELELRERADAARAHAVACALKHCVPHEAEDLALQPRYKADGPALVYVVTNASLGAVKVGVSDPDGVRIAQHRRAGWQLIAAFQVAAGAAAAIEADVLGWWRGQLGLPAYLSRDQIPQGGWTETADAARVDLAATVARVCGLALRPESRAAAVPRPPGPRHLSAGTVISAESDPRALPGNCCPSSPRQLLRDAGYIHQAGSTTGGGMEWLGTAAERTPARRRR